MVLIMMENGKKEKSRDKEFQQNKTTFHQGNGRITNLSKEQEEINIITQAILVAFVMAK